MTNDERHATEKDAYQRYLDRNTDHDRVTDWLEAENSALAAQLSEGAKNLLIKCCCVSYSDPLGGGGEAGGQYLDNNHLCSDDSRAELTNAGLLGTTDKSRAVYEALLEGLLGKVHDSIVGPEDVHLWGLRRRDSRYVCDFIWDELSLLCENDAAARASCQKENTGWPTDFALVVKPHPYIPAHGRLMAALHEEGHYTKGFLSFLAENEDATTSAVVESDAEIHALDRITRYASGNQGWQRTFYLFSMLEQFSMHNRWIAKPKIGLEYKGAIPIIRDSKEFHSALEFAEGVGFPLPPMPDGWSRLTASYIGR